MKKTIYFLVSLSICLVYSLIIFAAQNEQLPEQAGMDNRDYDNLVQVMLRGTPFQKQQAALTFGKAKERRAIQYLISAMKYDDSLEVRRASCQALTMMKATEALKEMVASLKALENIYKKSQWSKYNEFIVDLIDGISSFNEPSTFPTIVETAWALDRTIKRKAITSIVKLKIKTASSTLTAVLQKETVESMKKFLMSAIKKLKELPFVQ